MTPRFPWPALALNAPQPNNDIGHNEAIERSERAMEVGTKAFPREQFRPVISLVVEKLFLVGALTATAAE